MKFLYKPYKIMQVSENATKEELIKFWRKNKVKILEVNGKKIRVFGIRHLREICLREKID